MKDSLGGGAGEEWKWETRKEHKVMNIIDHFDNGNDFVGIYMSKNIIFYTLNTYSLFLSFIPFNKAVNILWKVFN